jgi:hypothetical protein
MHPGGAMAVAAVAVPTVQNPPTSTIELASIAVADNAVFVFERFCIITPHYHESRREPVPHDRVLPIRSANPYLEPSRASGTNLAIIRRMAQWI